jgi:hypothetical protein
MVEGSTSTSDQWRTPARLAALLGRWGIDPCSHARSHIEAGVYCRPDSDYPTMRDGLEVDWERFDSAFGNWPFSRPLPWAIKFAAYSKPWCVLAKLDPTTRAHATLMHAGATMAPFKKRIPFEGDKNLTAPFPCALFFRGWAPSRELIEDAQYGLWMARYA